MRAVCSVCFSNTMRAYLIATLYSVMRYLQDFSVLFYTLMLCIL